jgi:rubredoxin
VGSNPTLTAKQIGTIMLENRSVYQCTVCEHLHDEELDGPWEQLPKYWNCPECGCAKDEYVKLEL